MINPLRQHLPVHSPLPLAAVLTAVPHALRMGTDPRSTLTELLKRDYCAHQILLLSSGTHALQVALELASREFGPSTQIALPAYSCFDVATAAIGCGAPVRLYDLDPSTLGPDFASLERILERGAQVVVVSPLFGVPVDWGAIEDLTARFGARVVEDAAQGYGAMWNSRCVGVLGELSVLSFGRGKGWTGVRGGALAIRGRAVPRDWVAPSWLGAQDEWRVWLGGLGQCLLGRPNWYRLPASIPWLQLGETVYHDPTPPKGIAWTAAALAVRTHGVSRVEAEVRRIRAQTLLEGLSNEDHVRPIRTERRGSPGYLRLPLRLSRGLAGFGSPADVRRLGIVSSYPTTLAALPQIRPLLDRADGDWPGAEELANQLVTVPTHSRLSTADIEGVLRLLNTYPV